MGGKAPAPRLLRAPARAGLLVVLLCLPGTSVVGGDGGRPWRKAALAAAGAGAGDGGPPSSTYWSCCRPPPLRTLKAKVADLQDAIHAKREPPSKVALMQLCVDRTHCYLMHIIHSGVPPLLKSLLEDSSSVEVGVCMDNDARKMFNDYDVREQPLMDLSTVANVKLAGPQERWTLAALTEMITSKEVSDNYYRPDLTEPALARLSAIYRGLKVSKSGFKKNSSKQDGHELILWMCVGLGFQFSRFVLRV